MNGPLQKKILPTEPGCYLFKDNQNKIIYIGKAKNLKKRVSYYFQKKDHDPKTQDLVNHVRDVDFFVTDTELEALLLESKLIRLHKPKFNIDLKDSVRYAYLKITNEKFPRILTTREIEKDGAKYFGPYQDGGTRENAARMTRQIFKIRTCGDKLPRHACLQYYIKRCDAPCINNISQDEYLENVKKASLFLKGNSGELKKRLLKEMKIFSANQNYEAALEKRDQITAIEKIKQTQKVMLLKNYNEHFINYVQMGEQATLQIFEAEKGAIIDKKEFRLASGTNLLADFIKRYYSTNLIPDQIIIPEAIEDQELIEQFLNRLRNKKVSVVTARKGNKFKLLQMITNNILLSIKQETPSLVELRSVLNLNSIPNVIECFDISNIGGNWVVGSMVQFKGGFPNIDCYRRFKINTVSGQDDFASIAELVKRRYRRLIQEKTDFPDLIVIDGGKGQLSAAFNELAKLNLTIPIISLAKKFEEIYYLGAQKPIVLSRKSESLKLLQRIRNEAHRFAVKYHRLVRSKSQLN